MDCYSIDKYEDVTNPRYDFYVVYKNGHSFFEEFSEKLEQKADTDAFLRIISLMEQFGKPYVRLTTKQFRHISKKNKGYRKDIWEFKSNHIRVYVIQADSAFYILLGGYKCNQEKDIDKVFRHFNDFQS